MNPETRLWLAVLDNARHEFLWKLNNAKLYYDRGEQNQLIDTERRLNALWYECSTKWFSTICDNAECHIDHFHSLIRKDYVDRGLGFLLKGYQ